MPLGLYLHVPFCSSICHYCNFNRGLLDEALKRRYVAALEREIRGAGTSLRAGSAEGVPVGQGFGPGLQADTVYIGGGTPSLLDPAEVARLVAACTTAFAVSPDAEITLEANPETVTPARLAEYRAAGVNRVSLGVQSFRDEELKRLGRIHDAARARAAVAEARAAGFDNVSLDLMMWLPGQRVEQWEESVEALIETRPDHASLYLLELYPNASLREEMARAGWSLPPDEEAAWMYERAMERLEEAGYAQYEMSNVAQPGRQSRHNLKYWSDGEWLGFGCGAHSTFGGVRWKNVSATSDYTARVEAGGSIVAERRELTSIERFQEAAFTGLRLTEGVDLGALGRRYGVDAWAQYWEDLAPYVEAGLAVREGGRLRLTRRGLLLANEVMAVFVGDVRPSSTVK